MSVTTDILRKHAKEASFLLIGEPNTTIRISDANMLWSKSGSIVFHTGYRLAGTIENISLTLSNLGYGTEIVNTVLTTVITKNNHNTTFDEIYKGEQSSYNDFLNKYVQPDVYGYRVRSTPQPVFKSILINPTAPVLNPIAPILTPTTPLLKPFAPILTPTAPVLTPLRFENTPTPIAEKIAPLRKTNKLVNTTITKPQFAVKAQPVQQDFEDVSGNVDVFDFQLYKDDLELFQQYFTGLELYIRLAGWLLYKYVRLTEESERQELFLDLIFSDVETQIPRTNTKEWLELMSDVFDPEQMLWSWYKHFKPSVLYNVNNLYVKWQNHLNVFLNMLYRRYVDENHVDEPLWFL